MSRLALALAAAALLACTAARPLPPQEPGLGTRATFLLANGRSLLALDERCQTLGPIAQLPDQSAPATPSLHPDGRSLVFALTQLPDRTRGFGSDIFTVGLDGTGLRALVEHETENVFYASPRYDPSGTILYFHRRAAVVTDGEYRGNLDTIERLDLKTGKRERLLENATDLTLSPDGRTMLFVRMVDGVIDGLWRANADGTEAGPFFKTSDKFWYLQSPRFAPSGDQIVFSAAGHTTSRARRGPGLAHLGVPSDLFLAPADGTSVRSVGQTGDDVVPAWSPDGKRIAFVGTGGFFVLQLESEDIDTCAEGEEFLFGDLVWLK